MHFRRIPLKMALWQQERLHGPREAASSSLCEKTRVSENFILDFVLFLSLSAAQAQKEDKVELYTNLKKLKI